MTFMGWKTYVTGMRKKDKAMKSLKDARKEFDNGYIEDHGEIPESEEKTFNEYKAEKNEAVSSKKTAYDKWETSLDNAKASFNEKELELKEKLEEFAAVRHRSFIV